MHIHRVMNIIIEAFCNQTIISHCSSIHSLVSLSLRLLKIPFKISWSMRATSVALKINLEMPDCVHSLLSGEKFQPVLPVLLGGGGEVEQVGRHWPMNWHLPNQNFIFLGQYKWTGLMGLPEFEHTVLDGIIQHLPAVQILGTVQRSNNLGFWCLSLKTTMVIL